MVEALDHPIFFAVAITLVVFGMASIFRWGLKAMGMPGPANVFGG